MTSLNSFLDSFNAKGLWDVEARTPSAKIPLIPYTTLVRAYDERDGDFFIWLKAAYQTTGAGIRKPEIYNYPMLKASIRNFAYKASNKSFNKSVKNALKQKSLFDEHALQIDLAASYVGDIAKDNVITIREDKETKSNGNNCVPVKDKEEFDFNFEPDEQVISGGYVKKDYKPEITLNTVPNKEICSVFLPLENCVVGGNIFEEYDGNGWTVRKFIINWTDRETDLCSSLIGSKVLMTQGSSQRVAYSKYDTALRVLNAALFDAAVKGLEAYKKALNNISDKNLLRELSEVKKG